MFNDHSKKGLSAMASRYSTLYIPLTTGGVVTRFDVVGGLVVGSKIGSKARSYF